MTAIGPLLTLDPLVVTATTSIEECAEIAVRYGLRHLPVVDEARRVTGLVTDFLLFQQGRFVGGEGGHWVPRSVSGRPLVAGDIAANTLCTSPSEDLRAALARLQASRHDVMIAVDAEMRPVGILTEHDVVRHAGDLLPEGRPVATIASRPVLTVRRDDPLASALALMLEKQIRHVIVLSEDLLYGVLSLHDVVVASAPGDQDLRADDAISGVVVHKATRETTTRSAAGCMADWKIGCLPVVDDDDHPEAIVTRRDILRALIQALDDGLVATTSSADG